MNEIAHLISAASAINPEGLLLVCASCHVVLASLRASRSRKTAPPPCSNVDAIANSGVNIFELTVMDIQSPITDQRKAAARAFTRRVARLIAAQILEEELGRPHLAERLRAQ